MKPVRAARQYWQPYGSGDGSTTAGESKEWRPRMTPARDRVGAEPGQGTGIAWHPPRGSCGLRMYWRWIQTASIPPTRSPPSCRSHQGSLARWCWACPGIRCQRSPACAYRRRLSNAWRIWKRGGQDRRLAIRIPRLPDRAVTAGDALSAVDEALRFRSRAVVRLCWHGVKPVNLPAQVRYFRAAEGGVSHFNYLRDNLLLSWMPPAPGAGVCVAPAGVTA